MECQASSIALNIFWRTLNFDLRKNSSWNEETELATRMCTPRKSATVCVLLAHRLMDYPTLKVRRDIEKYCPEEKNQSSLFFLEISMRDPNSCNKGATADKKTRNAGLGEPA